MRYGKPGYLRSLVISNSFWVLSNITPNGFDERVSSPGFLARLPAAIQQIILQQEYEIPSSESTPDALLAHHLVTEFAKPGSNNGAALIIASAAGDLPTVQKLSDLQKKVHQELPLQEMLVAATEKSHAKVVEYCFQQGAVVDDDVSFAAYRGLTADLFEVLVPRNIFDISKHPEYLSDLLHGAVWVGYFNRPSHSAGSGPRGTELARSLIAHGAKVDGDVILQAARIQSVEFMECLLAHGAALGGSGALHMAASQGRLEMTKYLLDHGADVNELLLMDILGDVREPAPQMGFPLHYAVSCGRFDVVMLLLERGGDMMLRNKSGQRAFEIENLGGVEGSHQDIAQLLQYVREHREL